MEKIKKEAVEVSMVEANEIQGRVQVISQVRGEIQKNQHLAMTAERELNEYVRNVAKKHGLEGEDFVYEKGKIKLMPKSKPQETKASPIENKKAEVEELIEDGRNTAAEVAE